MRGAQISAASVPDRFQKRVRHAADKQSIDGVHQRRLRMLPAKLKEPFLQRSGAGTAGYVVGAFGDRVVKTQTALCPGEHRLAIRLSDLGRLADSPDDAGAGCRARSQYRKLTWHIQSVRHSGGRHADGYAECKRQETGRSATLNTWKQGRACDQPTQHSSQPHSQRRALVSLLIVDALE